MTAAFCIGLRECVAASSLSLENYVQYTRTMFNEENQQVPHHITCSEALRASSLRRLLWVVVRGGALRLRRAGMHRLFLLHYCIAISPLVAWKVACSFSYRATGVFCFLGPFGLQHACAPTQPYKSASKACPLLLVTVSPLLSPLSAPPPAPVDESALSH